MIYVASTMLSPVCYESYPDNLRRVRRGSQCKLVLSEVDIDKITRDQTVTVPILVHMHCF
jgi:hypothetical protein